MSGGEWVYGEWACEDVWRVGELDVWRVGEGVYGEWA